MVTEALAWDFGEAHTVPALVTGVLCELRYGSYSQTLDAATCLQMQISVP